MVISNAKGINSERAGRAYSLLFLFGFSFLFLSGHFFYIQIIRYKHYKTLAEENRLRKIILPACRGKIFDRNGILLVDSRPSYCVTFLSDSRVNTKNSLESLASFLAIEKEEIEEKVEKAGKVVYTEPIRILKDVGIEAVSIVEERRDKLNGVELEIIPLRRYSFGKLGGHLLGYLGEISEKEYLEIKSKGYHYGSLRGRTGIEEEYEELLKGIDGVNFLEVDSQGREVRVISHLNPRMGRNLYLTIDYPLQKISEDLLGDRSGAIVVLDPQNGEILALVSKPDIDPNLLSGGMTFRDWKRLNEDKRHPLWNRAIKGGYPAGSTFKLLTAIAALEEGIINKETLLNSCTGSWRFGKRFFKCWRKEGHGRLSLVPAIIQSCDIFFYQLGARLGLERLSSYALKCGLGSPTGVDLPQEGSGLIPTPSWYDRKLGKGNWTQGVAVNMAIGQGEVLVTPLQLASFYGAIACNGKSYCPHLLLRIEEEDGKLIKREKSPERTLPISTETIRILKEGLLGVVQDSRGTAQVAQIPGLNVAGKTGTAQNPHGKDHSWFVAYAPAEAPKLVVSVLVENAGHGSEVAAPIAKKIIESYFRAGGSSLNLAAGYGNKAED